MNEREFKERLDKALFPVIIDHSDHISFDYEGEQQNYLRFVFTKEGGAGKIYSNVSFDGVLSQALIDRIVARCVTLDFNPRKKSEME